MSRIQKRNNNPPAPEQDLEFNNKREYINLMENIVDDKAKNWFFKNKS